MVQNPFPGLPDEVFNTIASSINMEFATLTAQGVPLDTPTFAFINSNAPSIELATGLAYPAKAERARRNPKVGLLFEGVRGGPVVSVSAMAAVRDSNFQANADRYIAETGAYTQAALAYGKPWLVLRNAIWYWTRIIVSNTPVSIRWWPNNESLDEAPKCWAAPAGFSYPASDPTPPGAPAPSSAWPVRDWKDGAKSQLDHGIGAHLTIVDADGFPLPFRSAQTTLVSDGFDLVVPAGAPWTAKGKASLCFMGAATFIGEVDSAGKSAHFRVERALPVLPMVEDPKAVFEPSEAVRAKLLERLEKELARRGQAIPEIADTLPASTPGAALRAAQFAIFMEETKIRENALER